MTATDDPTTMAPTERRAEVSAILARAILRLHSRAALPARNSRDSARIELDSGHVTSPDVSVVNAQPLSEKEDA